MIILVLLQVIPLSHVFCMQDVKELIVLVFRTLTLKFSFSYFNFGVYFFAPSKLVPRLCMICQGVKLGGVPVT